MKINTFEYMQRKTYLQEAKKKENEEENFKVLRINLGEASKVKPALIKFHVKRLSRF